MLPHRKLRKSKRTKKKEADLMGFKLIINNQGQFVSELKTFPMDKIPLYFKRENAGVIQAMLRECKTNFTELHTTLEKIARDVYYS